MVIKQSEQQKLMKNSPKTKNTAKGTQLPNLENINKFEGKKAKILLLCFDRQPGPKKNAMPR